MSCRSESLYWLFWDMGFSRAECHHLVKCLDRLRLCNLGSDDWNRKFRQWAEMQSLKANTSLRLQIRRLLGMPIEKPTDFEARALFDDDLWTGR